MIKKMQDNTTILGVSECGKVFEIALESFFDVLKNRMLRLSMLFLMFDLECFKEKSASKGNPD